MTTPLYRQWSEPGPSLHYGAPMGWSNTPNFGDESEFMCPNKVVPETRDIGLKFHLRRVPVNGEGYDPQGYYYGHTNVWEAWAENLPRDATAFWVAPFRFTPALNTRDAARAMVREKFPTARFYR